MKIKVVAAENFYGEAAKAVGGSHVKVTSIISNPNVDPHAFQPTTETAKKVSDAKILIYNGLGYDDWMTRLINASSNRQKTVIRVGDEVMGKHYGENEHVWYIPQTMPKVAEALANRLAKLDPKHASDYRRNARAYQRSLQPLFEKVQQLKQTKPKRVIVTSPVFNNMLIALNDKPIDRNFSMAIEEGLDPKPKDMIQIQEDLKNHNASFLVDNIQVKNPVVTQLIQIAKQHHVPIVRVSEALPPGKTYKEWMVDQLEQIQQITNSD